MGGHSSKYCGEIHLTDYVIRNWKSHDDHFEFHIAADGVGAYVRKLESHDASIVIEWKSQGSNKWFIQIKAGKPDRDVEWRRSEFKWHLGAALYACHQYALTHPGVSSSAELAEGVVASMKRAGPRPAFLAPVTEDTNLMEWAKEAGLNLHIVSLPSEEI